MTKINGIEYLTVKEVSKGWDLEESYVLKLLGRGSIPKEETIKQSRNRLISKSYFDDMKGRAVPKLVYPWANH